MTNVLWKCLHKFVADFVHCHFREWTSRLRALLSLPPFLYTSCPSHCFLPLHNEINTSFIPSTLSFRFSADTSNAGISNVRPFFLLVLYRDTFVHGQCSHRNNTFYFVLQQFFSASYILLNIIWHTCCIMSKIPSGTNQSVLIAPTYANTRFTSHSATYGRQMCW